MSEDLPTKGPNPEKYDLHTSQAQVQQDSTPDAETLLKRESPGVKRIELLTPYIHLIDRGFLFFGIFLVAYAYGLDNQVRQTYQVWSLTTVTFFFLLGTRIASWQLIFSSQTLATASYQQHSLLSTVNVLRAVIAAAAQVRPWPVEPSSRFLDSWQE